MARGSNREETNAQLRANIAQIIAQRLRKKKNTTTRQQQTYMHCGSNVTKPKRCAHVIRFNHVCVATWEEKRLLEYLNTCIGKRQHTNTCEFTRESCGGTRETCETCGEFCLRSIWQQNEDLAFGEQNVVLLSETLHAT